MLSQQMQCILLKIHQYRVQILCKPGPEIFIAYWLSWHNHEEGKDEPIWDMDMSRCHAKCNRHSGMHLHFTDSAHNDTGWTSSKSKNIIIRGWPSTKDELHINTRPYWCYRYDLAVIDGVIMKGRHIIIPAELKQQVLDQLHPNHIGIEKTKLLTHESVYWININTDIENHIKSCNTCLEFQQTQPRGRYTSWHTTETMGSVRCRHTPPH